MLLRNSDANPTDYQPREGEQALVYHAEIQIGGQRLILSDLSAGTESAGHAEGPPLSLVLTFDTVDQVKAAYAAISEDCTIISPIKSTTYTSFVSLIDKFGVRWELMTEQPD